MSEQCIPAHVSEQVKYCEPPGYLGYRVGDDGSVWTRKNARWGLRERWQRMKTPPDDHGYPTEGSIYYKVTSPSRIRLSHSE